MKKVIITSVFMLITLVCFAQTCAEKFVELDTNQDGLISRTEANADAIVSNWFDIIDTDADDYINLAEFANFCS
ncbi:EF-hand domain-containing protein [uncultured Polaribacter sp.]|uniref:EF-hand domain-containing protein n=1 Tax=uncultured Polaribacter sp. TaxID=174711 RepID=UPI0026240F5D|nr:EF-hand domain-containing protein [uncultured Polaribacter sp.]